MVLPPPCPSDEEMSSCFEQEKGRGKRREGEKKKRKRRDRKRKEILLYIEMATYIERREKEKGDKNWWGKEAQGGVKWRRLTREMSKEDRKREEGVEKGEREGTGRKRKGEKRGGEKVRKKEGKKGRRERRDSEGEREGASKRKDNILIFLDELPNIQPIVCRPQAPPLQKNRERAWKIKI